ncbi:MFS transporter [Streptomyces sp. t39]|uniref:MFS transporter n=1 Tax=Streptomyces sp. t39 TaxID=1828156 RepID=UPI0021C62AC4|nr:MFS transporter [Streptomyces sp. t39]
MPADAGLPAHRDPHVLRWLGAYALSATGDSVYHVALTWAATRGGSAAEAGAVLAAGAVPRALLMLGGGVLADRVGPRTVVLVSDTARCLVVLGLAVLLWLATPGLWVLAAVAVVFGILDAVFMPAVGALPPRIAPRGQLARVQGLRGLAGRAATVAGAPLGGAATALSGAPAAFAAAAALFALSLPLLMTLRIAPLPARTADDGPATPSENGHGEDALGDARAAVAGVARGREAGSSAVPGTNRSGPAPRAPGAAVLGGTRRDAAASPGAPEVSRLPEARRAPGAEPTPEPEPARADGPEGAAEAGTPTGPDTSRPAEPARPRPSGARVPAAAARVAAAARAGGAWRRLGGDLRDGVRYARRHDVLGPLIVVVAVSDLGFVGPLGVGVALLAEARGWGAPGLGWLLAGFAAGSAAASLLLAVRGRIPRAGLVMGLALVGGSAAIAALALVPALAAAVAVAALVGVLTGVSGSLCGALLQTASDPAHLGRVTSLATFVSLGLAPLSFPLTGAALGLWGAAPVFAVSALVCAAGAVYGLCSAHLRRAELPH